MTTAAELFAVQETDLAIDVAVAKLTEVEAHLGESEELIAARERVDNCREKIRPLQTAQQDLDLQAGDVRAKAEQIEKKLYGGGVGNPKELEDLQADLTSLRGQLRKREDEELEVMMALDEAEIELKEAETALAEIERAWTADQSTLRHDQAELKTEIQELEAKRARQVEGMDTRTLSLYGSLRDRRQGIALALVERGLCQGCRIALPMSILQKARAGAGLVQCVSCERILLVN
jgi:predicted  nucleic acid-binding Zn-ribbon protein